MEMRNQIIHLPKRFALLTDSFLNYTYCIQKLLLEERRDSIHMSKLRGEVDIEEGELRLDDHRPPEFGKEVLVFNNQLFEVKFCIAPLLFYTTHQEIYPVVIIHEFHRIQRFIRTHSSRIVSVQFQNRVQELLRYLLNELDDNSLYIGNNRKWPSGLRQYPDQHRFNTYIETWLRPDIDEYSYTYEDYGLQGLTNRPPTPPRPSPPAQRPSGPPQPTERVASALARDSVSQGEVCPITQEPLKATSIGVTGCLCVFQGEALQHYKGNTCPSCRTPLTVRYINLTNKKEASNVSTTTTTE